MTTKQYGTVRGQCFVVGDTINYINRHGQGMRGILESLFVEERGLCAIKRAEWPSVEVINFGDEFEYPIVRVQQRRR
jgi:hypothetical protein